MNGEWSSISVSAVHQFDAVISCCLQMLIVNLLIVSPSSLSEHESHGFLNKNLTTQLLLSKEFRFIYIVEVIKDVVLFAQPIIMLPHGYQFYNDVNKFQN